MTETTPTGAIINVPFPYVKAAKSGISSLMDLCCGAVYLPRVYYVPAEANIEYRALPPCLHSSATIRDCFLFTPFVRGIRRLLNIKARAFPPFELLATRLSGKCLAYKVDPLCSPPT